MEEAKEKLRYEQMTNIEKQSYQRFVENRRIEMGVMETAKEDGFILGMQEGIKEGIVKTARSFKKAGVSDEIIANSTGLSLEEIQNL